jgi:purine-binding chemotaxis protein CheW
MPDEHEESEVFNGEKYLIFTILGKFYTFPSRIISEVTAFDTVYPLPLVPEYVMGIINRYSAPYALVDIGLLIQKIPTPQSKVVVLKETVEKIAFLIDDVVDIVDIVHADLLKVEQGVEVTDTTDIIEASFGWHDTNVFVLNIRQIINRVISEFRI